MGDTVLTVKDTSLEDVDVVTDFGEGQALDVSNSSLRGVNLFGHAQNAPDLHGIRAISPVTIEDTLVRGGYEEGLEVLGGLADQEVTARRLRIFGSGVGGVRIRELSRLTLSDSRVRAVHQAIASEGLAEVSRTVLETTGPDSLGLTQFAASGGFDLDHVTVAHRGRPSGTDVAVLLNTDNPDVDTRLHAVAPAGYTRGFRRVTINGFPHPVTVTDSVWDPARDELGGSAAGVFVESRNAHLAPAPVLTKLGLRVARLRVARAANLTLVRASRLRLVFTASEAATLRVVPRRLVDGRLTKARGASVQKVAAGNGSINLGKRLRRLGALRPGQLWLFVIATDAAGNRSAKRVLKLRRPK